MRNKYLKYKGTSTTKQPLKYVLHTPVGNTAKNNNSKKMKKKKKNLTSSKNKNEFKLLTSETIKGYIQMRVNFSFNQTLALAHSVSVK